MGQEAFVLAGGRKQGMGGTMGNIEQRQELATVMPRPLHTAKATLSWGTTRCASFSGRAGLWSVGAFVRL